MTRFYLSFICLFFSLTTTAQRITVEEYIKKYKADAVKDMQKTGVPASITLAQALLESENGNSPLAINANNHFGIKCHKEWTGPAYLHDDDARQECFRKYKNALESYDDHSNFLRTRDRYASLFQLPTNDYKGWAYGLKKAGYATNPKYPEMIIKLIEDNKLYELDNGYITPENPVLASANNSKNIAPAKAATSLKRSPDSKKVIIPTEEISPFEERVQAVNNVKCIITHQGDSYLSIANDHKMGLWQILKYNEISKNDPLLPGTRIYLAPKKRKAQESQHIVQEGETLHAIAQYYAIKLKHLKKMNKLKGDEALNPGTKLILQ